MRRGYGYSGLKYRGGAPYIGVENNMKRGWSIIGREGGEVQERCRVRSAREDFFCFSGGV